MRHEWHARRRIQGAEWAKVHGWRSGARYLYCVMRRTLAIRASTRAFWEGAANQIMFWLASGDQDG